MILPKERSNYVKIRLKVWQDSFQLNLLTFWFFVKTKISQSKSSWILSIIKSSDNMLMNKKTNNKLKNKASQKLNKWKSKNLNKKIKSLRFLSRKLIKKETIKIRGSYYLSLWQSQQQENQLFSILSFNITKITLFTFCLQMWFAYRSFMIWWKKWRVLLRNKLMRNQEKKPTKNFMKKSARFSVQFQNQMKINMCFWSTKIIHKML